MEMQAENGTGRGPVSEGLEQEAASVVNGVRRLRTRQPAPRPRVVQFSLTEEEFEEVESADGSRSHGGRWDVMAGAMLREDPARFSARGAVPFGWL